jgi:hypothetical protein
MSSRGTTTTASCGVSATLTEGQRAEVAGSTKGDSNRAEEEKEREKEREERERQRELAR